MALNDNIFYWKESLKSYEPITDDYYVIDDLIIENKNLIKKVDRLRELIICYCVMSKKDKSASTKILEEIFNIITSIDKIQYTEFVAFWKVVDMSFSIFKKLPDKKRVLKTLLDKYCKNRRKLYDKLGYSNVIVQALYDNGTSRRKSISGTNKLIKLIKENFVNISHVRDIKKLKDVANGYFLPDSGDKQTFIKFCAEFKINYTFGKEHQEKEPDMVLKINEHYFIIEAKHIKESGGAQDKQIVEIIEFIKYTEKKKCIHYVSFMDGIYFNKFIDMPNTGNSKIDKQKNDIENFLKNNKDNFFVNTIGLKILLKDLLDD